MTVVFRRPGCEPACRGLPNDYKLGSYRDAPFGAACVGNMSSEQRQLFEAAIAAIPPYPAERYAGKGIVICAGGARLFACAYVAIGILRRILGCRLPIQLWHLGDAEIGPPMRSLLKDFEVEVIDAFDFTGRHPLRVIG